MSTPQEKIFEGEAQNGRNAGFIARNSNEANGNKEQKENIQLNSAGVGGSATPQKSGGCC